MGKSGLSHPTEDRAILSSNLSSSIIWARGQTCARRLAFNQKTEGSNPSEPALTKTNDERDDEQIINDQNADEWARKSAGTASYCPYCGYSVVEPYQESDNIRKCPECTSKYIVADVR